MICCCCHDPQDFFTEALWERLPAAWRDALGGLSSPQVADLLLDRTSQDRRYWVGCRGVVLGVGGGGGVGGGVRGVWGWFGW